MRMMELVARMHAVELVSASKRHATARGSSLVMTVKLILPTQVSPQRPLLHSTLYL